MKGTFDGALGEWSASSNEEEVENPRVSCGVIDLLCHTRIRLPGPLSHTVNQTYSIRQGFFYQPFTDLAFIRSRDYKSGLGKVLIVKLLRTNSN